MEGTGAEFPVQVIGTSHPTLTWYHNNTYVNNDHSHETFNNGTINAEMKHSVGILNGKFTLKVISEGLQTPSVVIAHEKISPVPMAEFGQYVSQNHAYTNNGFIKLYQVSH